ncbi:hypothetical protein B0H14DRAFT_3481158 [Mycena olivaceomarginata]|nr:hypothetical protein B0H14DRAFT_3481158 [Mycena olivaceomarginata]
MAIPSSKVPKIAYSGPPGEGELPDLTTTSLSPSLCRTVPHRGKSKTQTRSTTSAGKRKQTSDSAGAPAAKKLNRRASVEEIEDEDAPPIESSQAEADLGLCPCARYQQDQPTVEEEDEDGTPTKPGTTRNSIHLFYEVVTQNSAGRDGTPGDKHYKSFHGNSQIITISKASRANLGKLIRHLKITSQ